MGYNLIIDGFLRSFDKFRGYCNTLGFSGMINPVDGVTYPNITDKIPGDIRQEVIERIEEAEGRVISVNAMFLRQSPKGVFVPHPVHTDLAMGKRSMMLYLNELGDCEGGTAFMVHKRTGLSAHPINEKQLETWRESMSIVEDWQITEVAEMRDNRALLFDSTRMHMALPAGGFGEGKTARLVMTVFYD